MRVAIHQPEYLPCLSLVAKASRADVLVLLDHVQFNRASLQHRAKIWCRDGLRWLTIPFVHRFPQRICDVEVADDAWRARHLAAMREAYSDAPAFGAAFPAMEGLLGAPYERVVDAAIASMGLLFCAFGLAPRTMRSSDLHIAGQKSELVLALCQRLGATHYLCGATAARAYLDHAAFAAAGIAVEVQEFRPPADRKWTGEPSGLSALDAWMQRGDAAREVLG